MTNEAGAESSSLELCPARRNCNANEMQKESRSPPLLRFIEFSLRLLATRAAPVVGQVFEGNAVVLCGVIDIAADGADILAGGFSL